MTLTGHVRFRSLIVPLVMLLPTKGLAQATVETVYLVPGSHVDIGFTDTPGRVRDWRVAVIDMAIDAAEQDPGFYWFEEGARSFDAWRETYRDDEDQLARMRRLLQADRLGIGATWLSPLVTAIPEAVPALTWHIEELEREFGYRPSVAVLNDVPSYPETLVDELAARGIRYLLVGANTFVSRPFPSEVARTPFYWESSSGARILTYVDPASYTAGIVLGPTCAKAWEPERFPADVDDIETMRKAISEFAQDADPRKRTSYRACFAGALFPPYRRGFR